MTSSHYTDTFANFGAARRMIGTLPTNATVVIAPNLYVKLTDGGVDFVARRPSNQERRLLQSKRISMGRHKRWLHWCVLPYVVTTNTDRSCVCNDPYMELNKSVGASSISFKKSLSMQDTLQRNPTRACIAEPAMAKRRSWQSSSTIC